MFKKVLIANRGEIAVRVIRACQEMGIKTVAVYSEADKNSLHIMLADEAVCIGPAISRKSYLNMESIIEVAKKTGAEAIHPGYGFLSEDSRFAGMCTAAGLKFIGPREETHNLTGEKIRARQVAASLGIPVVPGSDGNLSSLEEAVSAARKTGYPVVLKASGGGGGRGMKIARKEDELVNLLSVARGEAVAAFKKSDIYLEKFLSPVRHIEIQILADEYGNIVHLGERECSIQKRYQKLIEESPSPFVDEKLRERLGDAALKVMRAANYVNAGTVEFLVDREKNFYFNEINSRLQVEHPVTEMVTGVDLVRQQILIAAGEKLSFRQDDVLIKGWAMECRINAEDPDQNFRPAPGNVEKLILPGGFGVRVDTNLYAGYEIPPFYDSLVAKLVVWGESRIEAIRRMKVALRGFIVDGVKTTIPFHRKILDDISFIKGDIDTNFLTSRFSLN